jgi:GDP-4-dehydro-6-deoxy-D-mannose reductase
MNRILITGCNGFVARHFVDYIQTNKIAAKLMGIDVGESSALNGLVYQQLDLMDIQGIKALLLSYQPTHIAHFASVSSVSKSWEKPLESFTNNTNIFLNIVESVRTLGISSRILSVGSSEEYGNYPRHALPLKEHYQLRPCNPYAIARVAQEMISKLYADSYGLEIMMTRSFNHIGPGQREVFAIPSFMSQMIKAKNENHTSISVGNIDIVRDFLDVRDVVDAYYKILFFGRKGDVYNVCRGIGYTLREIIHQIAKIIDFSPELTIDPHKVRPTDNQIIIGDPSKLMTELNWRPSISLESSLRQTIELLTKDQHDLKK